MFWEDPFDLDRTMESCVSDVGALPRPFWATIEWGGKDINTASNIVFSNGEYDPWRAGGVPYNVSESTVSIVIEQVSNLRSIYQKAVL